MTPVIRGWFITTPARKKISCLHCGDFPENLVSRVWMCECVYVCMLVYVCKCMSKVCVWVYVNVKVNVGVCMRVSFFTVCVYCENMSSMNLVCSLNI